MQLTEKQRNFLEWKLKENFAQYFPSVIREKETSQGLEEYDARWLQLEEWLEAHVTIDLASKAIGHFKSNEPDRAFDLLVEKGLPVEKDLSF